MPKIKIPDPPKAETAAHYGVVNVTEQLFLNDFVKDLKSFKVDKPIHSELLNIGSDYGQNYGFTLYRTTIPLSKTLVFTKG